MTLFTSGKPGTGRILRAYLTAAAACAAVGFAYEQFSHGVNSAFMLFAFLFPLVGGAGVLGALRLWPGAREPQPAARKLYRSGIATLTLGSFMTGVFEIYGSAAPLVAVYWFAGAALVLTAGVLWAVQRPQRARAAVPAAADARRQNADFR